ncbi:hypothetical protein EYZ11_002037 [Aspergillus tanneri]|uniref:C2H2-type domain-containing protein n=1 Tax=Aspergillus tanneri TaxID=1220188 RepID=A0A4S3JRT6_9EURO|nr:hypothetical protein EYZ11_002037 [Aspergillus tanneri]
MSTQGSSPRLRKGETFHPSKRPPTSRDPLMSFPLLPRRSPTCPEALEAIAAGQQRMANILDNLELDTFRSDSPDNADDFSPAPRRIRRTPARLQTTEESDGESEHSRPMLQKESPAKVRRVNCHASDSGLGTSICSAETMPSKNIMATAGPLSQEKPSTTTHKLSNNARLAIEGRVLFPLLKEEKFRPYHTLVRRAHERIEKEQIVCLRDLEKTLLMSAPDVKARIRTYFEFCQVTISCLFGTVPHLNDRDLRMPTDRPYTNGYFLDLVSQINRFKSMRESARGIQLRAEAHKQGEKADGIFELRLTLEGGYAKTGRPAELVAHKDGESISMRTGEAYNENASVCMKRKAEDGVVRSMARRKKNAPPMDINKKCEFCDKVFQRPCDLTKHEKTHSRPFKCAEPTCKYHELGFPTEKETERHYNDKHCNTPVMYKCLFPNCSYQSKRQSNCKQHMEKTHKWKYVRSKNNGRIAKRTTPQRGSSRASSQTHEIGTPINKQVPELSTPTTGGISSPGEHLEHLVTHPQDMSLSFAGPLPTKTDDFQLFSNGSSMGGSPCEYNDFRTLPSTSTSFDMGPQMGGVATPNSGSAEFLTPATGTTHSPYEPVSTYPENSMFSFADPFAQIKPDDSLLFMNSGFGELPSMFDDPLACLPEPAYEPGPIDFDGLPKLDGDANILCNMDPWEDFFNRNDHGAM